LCTDFHGFASSYWSVGEQTDQSGLRVTRPRLSTSSKHRNWELQWLHYAGLYKAVRGRFTNVAQNVAWSRISDRLTDATEWAAAVASCPIACHRRLAALCPRRSRRRRRRGKLISGLGEHGTEQHGDWTGLGPTAVSVSVDRSRFGIDSICRRFAARASATFSRRTIESSATQSPYHQPARPRSNLARKQIRLARLPAFGVLPLRISSCVNSSSNEAV